MLGLGTTHGERTFAFFTNRSLGSDTFFERQLGYKITHLPNGILCLFFRRRIDYVPDFLTGSIHGFELIHWHIGVPVLLGSGL